MVRCSAVQGVRGGMVAAAVFRYRFVIHLRSLFFFVSFFHLHFLLLRRIYSNFRLKNRQTENNDKFAR